MALTVLSTNIGVPTPISTSIVSDTDDFATVIQLAGVVCATTASGIVTGAYANVAVNGTIFANGTFSAGVQTDDHSLVDIGATGLVIGGDRGIQTGPWSTISVAGTVSGREFGIMTDFSSAITVEATGTVTAGRAGLDGTALRVGSDSSVKIDGMVFAGGAGILLESSRTAVSVTGQVSSDDVAIDGLQSGSNSIAVSGLVSGKNVGVGLGFAASLDVAAGGVVSSGGIAVKQVSPGGGAQVVNAGRIESDGDYSINLSADDSIVVNSGAITGVGGVTIGGARALVSNLGTIATGDNSAVNLTGVSSRLVNDGGITAGGQTDAVILHGSAMRLLNSGTIAGRETGAVLWQGTFDGYSWMLNTGLISGVTALNAIGYTRIVNSGELSGSFQAVRMASSESRFVNRGNIDGDVNYIAVDEAVNSFLNADRGVIDGAIFDNGNNVLFVVNNGAINGAVVLGGGSDSYDGARGYVLGIVSGGTGNDSLKGGAFADTLAGDDGNDTLRGNEGNDVLQGGLGNDTISGDDGNDTIIGGNGDDTVQAGAGNDTVIVTSNDGNDDYDGGDGIDTLDYSALNTAVKVSLANLEQSAINAGNDIFLNFENVIGGSAADSFTGDDAGNLLQGNAGNDSMSGKAGADRLLGNAGDDSLEGGAGRDILVGGSGSDTFRYSFTADSPDNAGADVIRDFTTIASGGSGPDRIDLSRIDANTTTGGNQAFTFIGTAAFTAGASAGQLQAFVVGQNTYIRGDINNDGTADFLIVAQGVLTFAAGDFVL